MEGQDVARQALSFPEPFQNQHSAGGSPSKPCSKVDGTDGAAGAGGDDDDDGGYLSSEGEGIELRDDDGASSSDELEESGGAAPRPGAAAGPGEAQNPVGNMPLAAVVVHADSGIGAQAGSSRLDLPINPRRKVKASRHGREEGDWAAVGEIPEGSTPAFAFTGEESFPALQGPAGETRFQKEARCDKKLFYMQQFLDDEMLEFIVDQSNAYLKEILNSTQSAAHKQAHPLRAWPPKWAVKAKKMTLSSLLRWIALLFFMTQHRVTKGMSEEDLWKTDWYYEN
eukprot:CAMPEP_0180198158 /NCGR_PEP_ID=MMETSP0987-20121128/5016_1 /TAXON_ID=697907 /ORGANISM="non described non described, Strain CCMP2293" /LENGTH=282 /DNA_ID=CAMNT_0022153137 /DNA_START=714 /DNA_END=1562 /DNA_ORIENTATION=-